MTDNGTYQGPTDQPLRVLSLGAGVQSTTILLMALAGDIPPIDVAIFADTGWEPATVYEHLDRLEATARTGGIDVRRVSAGNIHADHIDPSSPHLFIRRPVRHPEWKGRQRTFIPFYVTAPTGKEGITYRTCTKTYKIEPVEKELRHLLGLKPRERWPLDHRIDQLFGISWDESHRTKDSTRPAIRNVYPLVDARITRDDCHRWMAEHGWTAPRSACIGCPYHRNDEWRRLRSESPAEFAQAVTFDARMRELHAAGRLPIEGTPYIHDSRVPLSVAPIDLPDDDRADPFGNECDGMCGV